MFLTQLVGFTAKVVSLGLQLFVQSELMFVHLRLEFVLQRQQLFLVLPSHALVSGHLLPQSWALFMLLNLTGHLEEGEKVVYLNFRYKEKNGLWAAGQSGAHKRGCADGGEMVSISVHPPPSGRWRLQRSLHLRLIWVVVNIVTSLTDGWTKRNESRKRLFQKIVHCTALITYRGAVNDGAVRRDCLLSLLHHGHLSTVIGAIGQAVDWGALGAGADGHRGHRLRALHTVHCARLQEVLLCFLHTQTRWHGPVFCIIEYNKRAETGLNWTKGSKTMLDKHEDVPLPPLLLPVWGRW